MTTGELKEAIKNVFMHYYAEIGDSGVWLETGIVLYEASAPEDTSRENLIPDGIYLTDDAGSEPQFVGYLNTEEDRLFEILYDMLNYQITEE